MKYVDVTDTEDVLGYLASLDEGIFDDVWPPAARAAGAGN